MFVLFFFFSNLIDHLAFMKIFKFAASHTSIEMCSENFINLFNHFINLFNRFHLDDYLSVFAKSLLTARKFRVTLNEYASSHLWCNYTRVSINHDYNEDVYLAVIQIKPKKQRQERSF